MLLSVDLMGFEANWYLIIYYVYIFFILNLEMLFQKILNICKLCF